MLRALFIYNTAGLCVYSRKFAELEVEEQLLSGFLTAMSDFSVEATGGKLERIHTSFGEQAILYYDEVLHLAVAAFTNSQDHPSLIKKILVEILDAFIGMFEDTIDSPKIHGI